MLRIIFAGTAEFAKVSLENLVKQNLNIVAVYTQPDKPAGRGQHLRASPVKTFAVEHHIPVYQPATLRDPEAEKMLQTLKPDLMVVAAYGLLLPKAVLAIPSLGCINIHASLLPRWRGAAPIQRAILAGDKVTGITIMQMNEGLDTGDILLQSSCEISSEETSETLFKRLAEMGAELIVNAIDAIQKKKVLPIPQDSALACHAAKLTKAEALINWGNPAVQIEQAIRAFYPWPIAYSYLEGELVRIWKANISSESSKEASPGTILSLRKDAIHVATGKGILAIRQLQFAGGKPLDVSAVLHAKSEKFAVGKRFGS